MTKGMATGIKSAPAGITLVETLVIMSATAVLSGIVVTGMAAVFRYHHSVSSHFVGQTALQQLATTLRDDIHQASGCQWDRNSQTLRLELPAQQTLAYYQTQRRWLRVLTAHDAQPTTTSYRLDDSFRCDCRIRRVDQGELVRFTLINQPLELPQESAQTERALRCEIVAVVGRDYSPLHD